MASTRAHACSGNRYGEETAGLSRAQNGGGAAGGVPFGLNDDFDPEQLFNMFFNGGFGGGGFGGARWGDLRAASLIGTGCHTKELLWQTPCCTLSCAPWCFTLPVC